MLRNKSIEAASPLKPTWPRPFGRRASEALARLHHAAGPEAVAWLGATVGSGRGAPNLSVRPNGHSSDRHTRANSAWA